MEETSGFDRVGVLIVIPSTHSLTPSYVARAHSLTHSFHLQRKVKVIKYFSDM